jgi:hypothetical protein
VRIYFQAFENLTKDLFLSLIITLLHVSFTVSFTDEDDTLTELETKVKKPKDASASKYSLDQNVSRLMRSMTSARRKCFLNRLDSHNVVLC